MEASGSTGDPYGNSPPRNAANDAALGDGVVSGNGDSFPRRSLGLGVLQEIPALNLLRFPLSMALEFSGLVPARLSSHSAASPPALSPRSPARHVSPEPCIAGASSEGDSAEVSIRINGGSGGGAGQDVGGDGSASDEQPGSARSSVGAVSERDPLVPASPTANHPGGDSGDSSSQSYDIQQIARWIEQILPFSILLLVVFIRQHLIGFFVTIWISAVMYKSNDIVRRQTALKGERKSLVLVGLIMAFMLHVVGVYWLFRNDDILYPLAMLPPSTTPPFWHAIFIILVNDTLSRQAAMALKCLVLIYYKNGRGYNFRRQGQMLTLIEYTFLLYRVLLPTPVWYRFFLNKEFGSLFSSLTTGLYLTFKLSSVVEKVRFFLSAAKALSQREVLYGSHATPEQVSVAGDHCAICQEKLHSPILLRCKHIFCEDCVSEWFERERTCPLCRALVKPPDLRTFGDGSTNLLFQLF